MTRMFAIIEREMRKFFRSPTLMIMSLMMPLLQLVIMGNAFGGKIVGARVGVVDYDRGPQAIKIREAFAAIAANVKTFTTVDYTSETQAREDVRTGKIDGAVVIPAQYSRRVYSQDAPQLGLVVDNSDQFMSGSIESEMQIGGGMLYIDDKARGVHEGYLVTPITKIELVFGMNLAGAMKATLAGISLTVIGSLMAGLGIIFRPEADLELLAMILVSSIAFNGMMFLLMVRVDDPLVPRAMFGVLNTLLLYPSGGMYPIAAFPRWLQAISIVDPFTYVVHGFKAILLKDGGFEAIWFDLFFLFAFGIGTLLIATPLFKRTL